jgi:hypothetical protein
MATEKLEELTIDQLKKKDKGFTRLLIILVISWVIILTSLFILKSPSAVIFVCVSITTLLPFGANLKKIKDEIKKRDNLS